MNEMQSTKYKILKILYEQNKLVSSKLLSEELGISRSAVWKAVKALNSDGYDIQSAQSSGYELKAVPKTLSEYALRLYLAEELEDILINIPEKTGSTNADVMNVFEEKNSPQKILIATNHQTAGRGRYGRDFLSVGEGLYFTYGEKYSSSCKICDLITVNIAVAVCETIKTFLNIDTDIKWVNDILSYGKKIAGILTQAKYDLENKAVGCSAVGVGINIAGSAGGFPAEIRNRAGALYDKHMPEFDYNKFLAGIINNYVKLSLEKPEKIIDLYKSRCVLLNKKIKFAKDGKTVFAEAVDIDNNGHLMVRLNDGRLSALMSEEVEMVREDN